MTGLLRRIAPRRKPQADPVGTLLHDAVLRRDGECVAAKLGFAHTCRDSWGVPHAPYALPLLTCEHVKDELRMGVRAPSDMAHLVAACGYINLMPPTRVMRAAFREYLAAHAHVA